MTELLCTVKLFSLNNQMLVNFENEESCVHFCHITVVLNLKFIFGSGLVNLNSNKLK